MKISNVCVRREPKETGDEFEDDGNKKVGPTCAGFVCNADV